MKKFQSITIKAILFLLVASGLALAVSGTWTTWGIYKPPLSTILSQEEQNANNTGLNRLDARLAKEIWVGDPSIAAALGTPAEYMSSLAGALVSIGSTPCTLHAPRGTYTISSDTAIPINIELRTERGANFAIANTKTLTINGGFDAGLHQVFSCTGTGKVAGLKTSYPEWFDNDLTKTFASASEYTKIIFTGTGYTTNGVVLNTNYVTLFSNSGGTITQNVTGVAAPVITLVSNYVVLDGLTIVNQIVVGNEADERSGCIDLSYSGTPDTRTGITIKNCRLSGQGGISSYNGAAAFAMKDITIEDNYVRTLHRGIVLGPWGRNAVVNDNIKCDRNDIEITAAGAYSSYEYARPLQIMNTNNLFIKDNKSFGGFSGIETYGGGVPGGGVASVITINSGGTGYKRNDVLSIVQAGASGAIIEVNAVDGAGIITSWNLIPSGLAYSVANGLSTSGGSGAGAKANITSVAGKPYQRNVQITGNTTDGHIGATQIWGGQVTDNTVDMALRNTSFPKFDDAAIVAAWGYMSGIEVGDVHGVVYTDNTIRNQVGPGMVVNGITDKTNCNSNTIYNCGNTADVYTGGHGMFLSGRIYNSSFDSNNISYCSASGIFQDDQTAYALLNHSSMSHNKISYCQNHGIKTWAINGTDIDDNKINDINLVAGNYDAINLDGSAGVSIGYAQNALIMNNNLSGGRYGIYDPYAGPTEQRSKLFANNMSGASTTAPYLIYGRVRNNQVSTGIIPTVSAVPADHISGVNGYDIIGLDPGAADTVGYIDGGTGGNRILIRFVRADTLLVHDANYLVLKGAANVTPAAGAFMEFVCIYDVVTAANVWVEINRSF